MEYDRLVREAWRFTWRARPLWILGLFAGGAAGPSCSWTARSNQPSTVSNPDVDRAVALATAWFTANAGALITIAVVFVLIGLVLGVVSIIAQGGMAHATAELAAGRPAPLGEAWTAGLRYGWRYLGLWLLVLAAVIVFGIAAIVCIVLLGLTAANADVGAIRILLALGLAVLAIALGFAFATVIAFAQRAIAIEDIGPWDAIAAGWRLFRANLMTSAVLWVVAVVLGIVTGVAIAIGAAIVAVPLAIAGAVMWFTSGPSVALVVYAVVVGAVLLAAILLIAAIANTFFWHYWTLAYLRLRGRGVPIPAPAA